MFTFPHPSHLWLVFHHQLVNSCGSSFTTNWATLVCIMAHSPVQAHPNSIALFVPAEITTYCFYPGECPCRVLALLGGVQRCSAAWS